MKKILAFAGSNSSTSINHELVLCAVEKLDHSEVKVIRLTDYPLPMYGEDLEREEGFPEALEILLAEIKKYDAVLLSANEHNGTVSAFFKNVLDWLSRIEYKFLADKTVLLMSTSNGQRGALSSREYVKGVLPRFGAKEVISFGLPSYSENFSEGKINHQALDLELTSAIKEFESSL